MSFPFLPKNPNCSGCSQSSSSLGCNDPCNSYLNNTDQIVYNGQDLTSIGVNKCDSFTVVLQKINEAFSGGIIPTTSTSTTIIVIPTTTSTTTIIIIPTTSTSTTSAITSSTSTTSTTSGLGNQNLLACSNKLDEFEVWNQGGGDVLPREQDIDNGWTLTFAAGASLFQTINASASTTYTFSLDLKDVPTDTSIYFYSLPSYTLVTFNNIYAETNPSTYTRIEKTFTTVAGTNQIIVAINTAIGGNINARNLQINIGGTSIPYQETACGTTTSTTSGLPPSSTTSTTIAPGNINLLNCSNKFNEFEVWTQTEGADVLPRTPVADYWELTFAPLSAMLQQIVGSPSIQYTFSAYLRDVPTDMSVIVYSLPSFTILLDSNIYADTNPSTFTRVIRSFTTIPTTENILIALETEIGGTIDIRDAQINEGVTATAYVEVVCGLTTTSTSTQSQISTSTTSTTSAPVNINLLSCSNKFDEFETWQQNGGLIGVEQEIDGSWTLEYNTGNEFIFQNVSGISGQPYTLSAYVKSCPSGFTIGLSDGDGTVFANKDITTDVNGSTFTRVSVTGTLTVGQSLISAYLLSPSNTGILEVRDVQLNAGSSATTYIDNTCGVPTTTLQPTTTSTSTTQTPTTTTTTTVIITTNNMLVCSNQFDEFETWQQYGGVVEPVQQVDDSWDLTFDSGEGIFQLSPTVIEGQAYTFSAEFSSTFTGFEINIQDIGGGIISSRVINAGDIPGPGFTRLSVTGIVPMGQNQIAVSFYSDSSTGTVNMQNAQLNMGSSATTYEEVGC